MNEATNENSEKQKKRKRNEQRAIYKFFEFFVN